MNWKSDLHFDSNAMLLIEISRYFLGRYFKHKPLEADGLINRFFETYSYIDENYVHHNSSWKLANAIHYTMFINGKLGGLAEWQVNNGLMNPSDGAILYMKQRYWGRIS